MKTRINQRMRRNKLLAVVIDRKTILDHLKKKKKKNHTSLLDIHCCLLSTWVVIL